MAKKIQEKKYHNFINRIIIDNGDFGTLMYDYIRYYEPYVYYKVSRYFHISEKLGYQYLNMNYHYFDEVGQIQVFDMYAKNPEEFLAQVSKKERNPEITRVEYIEIEYE